MGKVLIGEYIIFMHKKSCAIYDTEQDELVRICKDFKEAHDYIQQRKWWR